ncbi:hypothetical protein [Deinococcus roseus]|uniref:Uncharacterized protein n=1 Tax=Deinococcus roseus TaxID=392414 RepID=A0ABQ2D5R3_9DEIO|nr:hypothetical protein [Deinococcus roseus]GGJ44510.1 hypothetical protein GCM10008938_33390 [Deinococcus roseus]
MNPGVFLWGKKATSNARHVFRLLLGALYALSMLLVYGIYLQQIDGAMVLKLVTDLVQTPWGPQGVLKVVLALSVCVQLVRAGLLYHLRRDPVRWQALKRALMGFALLVFGLDPLVFLLVYFVMLCLMDVMLEVWERNQQSAVEYFPS